MNRCSTLALAALAINLACTSLTPVAAQSLDVAGGSFFTLQGENATISSARITDRYYTNGLRIGYVSPEDAFPVLSRVTAPVFGDGHPRLAFDLTQQIYTPNATQLPASPKGDEPYAGVLLANVAAVQDGTNSRASVGLSLGVVGPAAMGEEVQNGFHDLIGQGHNLGWRSQLHNEPVFGVNIGKIWRQSLTTLGGLELDALPAIGATAGNLRSAAEAGVTVRLGRSLQNDFGVAHLRGLSGGDVFRRGEVLGWYVFAGAKGDAVANDITLNGNTFTTSPHVTLTPMVGELSIGAAVMGDGFRVTYTQTAQTQTFKHQKGGLHQLGSLGLSLLF